MQEIGSEFHYCDSMTGRGFQKFNLMDEAYVFSGRTAIETVLNNIPSAKRALLPSYCCESMIVPFRKANIEVEFYDVYFDEKLKIQLEEYQDADIILWCNYFGFKIDRPDFTKFIENDGIVIEDITHSFLSSEPYDTHSSYLVASIRKWGPLLSGGYCGSTQDALRKVPVLEPAEEFISLKKEAMMQKKKYIEKNENTTKDFLCKFAESNKWLADNYSQLTIDIESKNIFLNHDWEMNRKCRRDNARILYNGLKDCTNIQFLFHEDEMDCPLFVPVIIINNQRDAIRQKLIENKIYCPIHWPKPNDRCKSNLYDWELSLICDYRYKEVDMRRIISIIQEYTNNMR